MKEKLAIVTGNKIKFQELSAVLGEFFDCEQKEFDAYEIQGTSEEIVRHKLELAYEKFQEAVLVDDVSLHFKSLGGFPGPYIKSFFDYMPRHDVGVKFAGDRVEVVCWLGLMRSPDDVILVKGSVTGSVEAPKEKAEDGYLFDIFVRLDGTDELMVDLSQEEKNKHSHRGKALESLLDKLVINKK